MISYARPSAELPQVTSAKPGNGVEALRDGSDDTFWQSDGALPHLVNIQFQRKARHRFVGQSVSTTAVHASCTCPWPRCWQLSPPTLRDIGEAYIHRAPVGLQVR